MPGVNKMIREVTRIQSKHWKRFQISGPVPSVDPMQPPAYNFKVQGERGDGLTVTIPVSIDKRKIDMALPKDIIAITGGILNNGIKQLLTFTGCSCTMDTECDEHKPNVTVH